MNGLFIQLCHSEGSQKLFKGSSGKCHATAEKYDSCLITLQTHICFSASCTNSDLYQITPVRSNVLNSRSSFDQKLLDWSPSLERQVEIVYRKSVCSSKPHQFKRERQMEDFISVCPAHTLCTANGNLFTELQKAVPIMTLLNTFCSLTLLGR